jgi:hypothetical protein
MRQDNPTVTREVAKRLDGAIIKLRRREKNIAKRLGACRVEELRLFAAKAMEPRQEIVFKQGMSWTDKELVWLWRVIECARDEKVEAWRETTLSGQPNGVVTPSVSREFGADGLAKSDMEWRPGRRKGRTLGRVNQQMLELIIAA